MNEANLLVHSTAGVFLFGNPKNTLTMYIEKTGMIANRFTQHKEPGAVEIEEGTAAADNNVSIQ